MILFSLVLFLLTILVAADDFASRHQADDQSPDDSSTLA
jgi:hypothetical protein